MTIKIKRGAEQTVIEIADAKHLVLDVQGVEYISSEGLGVLLSAQKKMQKKALCR